MRTFLLLLAVGLCMGPGADAQSTRPARQPLSRQQPSRKQAINQWPEARAIDKARLVRAGFRVLEGRHMTLITDLPESQAVDELPAVVDAAVPILSRRFGVGRSEAGRARVRGWRVLAMLIQDRAKFAAAGLLPEGNEAFPDGLSIGYELWVAEQPSDYYRRHLLLHELTHSFMATQLGGCGPGWYMEGMAELLGTHRWQSQLQEKQSQKKQPQKLQLGTLPVSRQAVPMWGRTKLIGQAVANRRMLSIASVMQIDNRQALGVESYAWVWALAKFLDTHPRYRDRFRSLQTETLSPDFNAKFQKLFARDRSELDTEWRLFVGTLEYNHQIERESIDWPRKVELAESTEHVKVVADRGWQSTGYRLEGGERYEIKASGRFVVGKEPDGTPWPSEPGGITLAYYGGRPVGRLLAALDDRPTGRAGRAKGAAGTSAFLHPQSVGLRATLAPRRSGVLYLRVNDSPGSLGDNRGNLEVSIRRLPNP